MNLFVLCKPSSQMRISLSVSGVDATLAAALCLRFEDHSFAAALKTRENKRQLVESEPLSLYASTTAMLDILAPCSSLTIYNHI